MKTFQLFGKQSFYVIRKYKSLYYWNSSKSIVNIKLCRFLKRQIERNGIIKDYRLERYSYLKVISKIVNYGPSDEQISHDGSYYSNHENLFPPVPQTHVNQLYSCLLDIRLNYDPQIQLT